METPSTVSDYFDIVDDFFGKQYREEQSFRLAFKSKRPVEILEKKSSDDKKEEGSSSTESLVGKAIASSFVKLAPVVCVNRDGSTKGRLKVGSILDIGDYCSLYQRCGIDTEGKVTVKADLTELVQGLELKAKFEVNTLAPAAEDVVELEAGYQRGDVYVNGAVAGAGNGDQGVTFDLGTKVSNATIGVGISRDIHEDSVDHVMYLGAGFCGDNWAVAGKVTRENNEWNSIDVALSQVLAETAQASARINLDIPSETTLMDIGVTQPLNIGGLENTAFSFINEWFGKTLTMSGKLSSNGMFTSLLGFTYKSNLHAAITSRWNLLDTPAAPATFGIQLTLEEA